MAQNIHLKDRVRFLPGLKKKDLPPMFDCNFVGTVYMQIGTSVLPNNFAEWRDSKYFNYDSIVGRRDNSGSLVYPTVAPSTISELDWSIFTIIGSSGENLEVINPAVNNLYPLYYNEARNPETEGHSGFIFYTLYDLNPQLNSSNKFVYSFAIDIWESKVLINDASTYEEIN